jgi:hypothetical protein
VTIKKLVEQFNDANRFIEQYLGHLTKSHNLPEFDGQNIPSMTQLPRDPLMHIGIYLLFHVSPLFNNLFGKLFLGDL